MVLGRLYAVGYNVTVITLLSKPWHTAAALAHVLPTTYSKNTRTAYVQYVVRDQNERTGTL
jgi:hypothetical protein